MWILKPAILSHANTYTPLRCCLIPLRKHYKLNVSNGPVLSCIKVKTHCGWVRICAESEIFCSSQKDWSASSIICLTFRRISHFIKSFCLNFSLYKYKLAVLFKTNTVYLLSHKCFLITIYIFFPFVLPIIYNSHA